jgi:hypothetical protein
MVELNIPEFIEEKHAYCVNGQPVAAHVTGVITGALGANPFWTDEGRDMGSAVHQMIHYYAEGDLDYDALDDTLRPYLDAYIKFCADMQFKPDLIEQPLYKPSPLYCGKVDQVQLDRAVVDFKRGQHLPEHGVQLAAYAHMLPNPLKYERWGVRLLETGKYNLTAYRKQDMTSDYNVFISMLNVFNWRKRYGSSRAA